LNFCASCAPTKKNIKLYTIVGQPQVSSPFLLHLKIWVEKIVMNANIKLSLVKRKKKEYRYFAETLRNHRTIATAASNKFKPGEESWEGRAGGGDVHTNKKLNSNQL